MSHEAKAEANYDENSKSQQMDHMSRAGAAVGLDTIKSLQGLTVCIVGMCGVGVETAKNLILTGLKECILCDSEVVQVADMGANFYLRPEHIGKVSRCAASLSELSSLNPLGVQVSLHDAPTTTINEAWLSTHSVGALIVTKSLAKCELVRLNQLCRSAPRPITFVLALTHGLTGSFFSDFGNHHVITDRDGEPKRIRIVHSISNDYKVKIALEANQANHGLEDELYVTFDEVEGAMLNKRVFKVKRLYKKLSGPPKREILDVDTLQLTHIVEENKDDTYTEIPLLPGALGVWTRGGMITETKAKKIVKFQSLADCLFNAEPSMGMVYHPNQASLFSGMSNQLHFAFHATLEFFSRHNRLPTLHDKADAATVVAIARELLVEASARVAAGGTALTVETIDESVVLKFALYSRAELAGYAAFLGGFAAQEVHKRFGKFTPIQQFFHVDHFCLLDAEVPIDAAPQQCRYDHQIEIFGAAFHQKITNQRWFLVGSGALGCEYLKAYACMGLGSGPHGQVFVTDMDRIELSNLSRQFLFRSKHLNKPKSVCAAAVAREINPDLKITTFEVKVCDETENIFDDAFWMGLDGVWNALDNWKARQYTDFKCCLYKKPLLESVYFGLFGREIGLSSVYYLMVRNITIYGTEGTKTNSEIIIPQKTATFSDNPDQGTGGIPMCTLQNFPYLIDHCIEWARPEFEELFDKLPGFVNDFLSARDKFFAKVIKQDNKEEKKIMLSQVLTVIQQSRDRSWSTCLQLAYAQFTKQYTHRIRNLVQNFPEAARSIDSKTGQDMGPFWAGHKRFPNLQQFDAGVPQHFDYVFVAANLFAFSFGLPSKSEVEVRQMLITAKLVEPFFQLKKVNIGTEPAEEKKEDHGAAAMDVEDDDAVIAKLMKELAEVDTATVQPLKVNEFEKDDDTNFHIDFITVAANLRACNFHIKLTTRFHAKITAGRIIPALATTTAMVTGLVQLEFYKLLKGLAVEHMVNCNINMAKGLEFFNFFEPSPKKDHTAHTEYVDEGNGNGHNDKYIAIPDKWSRWDMIDVNKTDITVEELVTELEEKYGVAVESLFKFGLSQKDIDDGNGKNLYIGADALMPARRPVMLSAVAQRYVELYGALICDTRRWILLDGWFTKTSDDGEEVTVEMPPIRVFFKNPMEL